MQLYKITARGAQIGPGQVVSLSKEQYADRTRLFEAEVEETETGEVVAIAKTLLEFKVGELVGLPDLPKNLIGLVEEYKGNRNSYAEEKKKEAEAKAAAEKRKAAQKRAEDQRKGEAEKKAARERIAAAKKAQAEKDAKKKAKN